MWVLRAVGTGAAYPKRPDEVNRCRTPPALPCYDEFGAQAAGEAMPVRVDEEKFEECGRVAGAAIAAYTMRAMEKWRRTLTDYDCVMIMISVIAIGTARLARGEFPPAYRSLAVPIDPALLGKVNIAGIAHATGLNRETARRKVNDLIEQGMLVRHADGGIGLSPGLMQEQRVREQVRGQLGEIAAVAEQLGRIGVITLD